LPHFTRDLRNALNLNRPDWDCPVVTVTDNGSFYGTPQEVRFGIFTSLKPGWLRAGSGFSQPLHVRMCSVSSMNLEFLEDRLAAVINLLRRARMPVVTTLHTILADPSPETASGLHRDP
jgi:hypothetical protein